MAMKGIDLDLLLDPEKRIEALEQCVRDWRDWYIAEFGCFPIDRHTPKLRLRRRAMTEAYDLVGPPEFVKRVSNSSKLEITEPASFKQLEDEIEQEYRSELKKTDTEDEDATP